MDTKLLARLAIETNVRQVFACGPLLESIEDSPMMRKDNHLED
jgi:hypothetical protein